jgi:aspartyl-tRNA(Asn)/glutamyl-tRNA(Gln) amidotransferase subunit A
VGDGGRRVASPDPEDTLTDLCLAPLSEVAAMIGRREVSPVELLETVLARAAALASLNSFITVAHDEARARARELEAELASGHSRGPLHGIPVSLKDNISTRGIRTTAGSPILQDNVPSRDAAVVARLEAAGAVVFAKASLFGFASGDAHPQYSPCPNPWSPERYAGGSSSGSAVSVAAGLGFASLGTDSGGSIRIPSAFCGVVGVRPSDGRVGRTGVIPFSYSLDSVGPITRTVRDAAIVLNAIAGWDAGDPGSAQMASEDFTRQLDGNVHGLRIGVAQPDDSDAVVPEMARALDDVSAILRESGATVTQHARPDYALAQQVKDVIFLAEASEYHHVWFRDSPELYHEPLRTILEDAEVLPASLYVRAQRMRACIRDRMIASLADVDAVVAPAVGLAAPRSLRTMEIEDGATVLPLLSRHTSLASVAGLPAVVAPVGQADDGMPIGYQLIGKPGSEAALFRIAYAVEQATGWDKRHPPLSSSAS